MNPNTITTTSSRQRRGANQAPTAAEAKLNATSLPRRVARSFSGLGETDSSVRPLPHNTSLERTRNSGRERSHQPRSESSPLLRAAQL